MLKEKLKNNMVTVMKLNRESKKNILQVPLGEIATQERRTGDDSKSVKLSDIETYFGDIKVSSNKWRDVKKVLDKPISYYDFLKCVEEKKQSLRNKVTDLFNNRWENKGNYQTKVIIHIGPTNSGKTRSAIESFKKSSGTYLAPLRLLAWEVADKLNEEGCPCSLLTGEEIHELKDAKVISSTIEMFNSDIFYDTIVIDECQMLADKQRGWAWTRAIAFAKTNNLHIIIAPYAKNLLLKLLNKLNYEYEIKEYKRFSELKIDETICKLHKPPANTIFVTFSRISALTLKNFFENLGHDVSVIYGALPPDVRRKQANRFISGETKICVATDAIGMGMNLPAKMICFTQMEKYDGEQYRYLLPEEVMQIAGRAGRYKEPGSITVVQKKDLKVLSKLFNSNIETPNHCYLSPEKEDLSILEGRIYEKLCKWEKLNAIPDHLSDIFKLADLTPQKTLANMLKEDHEEFIGFDKIFTLVKAPASKFTYVYWKNCINSIVNKSILPLPSKNLPRKSSATSLEEAEILVEKCEIYLWIANRKEFKQYVGNKNEVIEAKNYLSSLIDEILMKKIDASKKCSICRVKLPLFFRYNMCENCFYDMKE